MTSMPDLVCLTTSGALGGAETSLLTLLRAFRRLEPAWRITVIAPASGPLLDACAAAGIGGRVLPFPAAISRLGESGATGRLSLTAGSVRALVGLPGYVRAVRGAIADAGARVIHSNGLKMHVAAALARPAGVRLVWHLHDYVRARPFSAALLRHLVGRTGAVVATSDSVLDDARAAFGGRGRLRRIHNAVDPEVFRPDGGALDLAALSGMPSAGGLVRVGLVATFGRWKGHDVFIDALARLQRRDAVRAYVVGGPVYETVGSQWTTDELRRRAEARGLADVLGFTGAVADVPAALRGLDVVVHASTQPEPFGMAIAEGMAAGRCVVAVRDGGAKELFADGVTAVGVPPRDAVALAAALDEVIDRPALRAELGARAREAALERFAPPRMAAEFREAYLG